MLSVFLESCHAELRGQHPSWVQGVGGLGTLGVSDSLFHLPGGPSITYHASLPVSSHFLFTKANQWSWNHPVDIVYIAACLPDSHMFSFMVPFTMYISKFSKSQVFLGTLVCTKFSLKLNLKLSA